MSILPFFSVIHAFAALTLGGLVFYGSFHHDRPLARALLRFFILIWIWTLIALLTFMISSLETKILLNRVKMVDIEAIFLALFAVGIELHGGIRLKWRHWAALALIPVATSLLCLSPLHTWVIRDYRLVSIGGHQTLAYGNGPWFPLHAAYGYLLIAISLYFIFRAGMLGHSFHRRKARLIFWAILIPSLADALAVAFFPVLRYLQTTPLFMSVTAILLAWAVFRYRALEVIPVARGLIVDSIADPQIILDDEGCVIDANRAAILALEIAPEHFGDPPEAIFARSKDMKHLADLLAEAAANPVEGVLIEDGSRRTYEISKKDIFTRHASRRIGSLLSFHDVSARKQVEADLRDLSAMKSKLLGIVAHDLIGNVRAISNLSDSILADLSRLSREDLAGMVELIRQSAMATSEFVDQIVRWASAQTESGRMSLSKTDFRRLAEESIEFLRPTAAEKNVELSLEAPLTVPVDADADMMLAVFRNLIANAIKFSPHDGVVAVEIRERSEQVSVSVRDDGRGIPPQDIDKLFPTGLGPARTGAADGNGTGLGLILCKDFVSRHGGRIWAENLSPTGSLFRFAIPKRS